MHMPSQLLRVDVLDCGRLKWGSEPTAKRLWRDVAEIEASFTFGSGSLLPGRGGESWLREPTACWRRSVMWWNSATFVSHVHAERTSGAETSHGSSLGVSSHVCIFAQSFAILSRGPTQWYGYLPFDTFNTQLATFTIRLSPS